MQRNLAADFFFFSNTSLLSQSLEMLIYSIHKLTVDFTHIDMYIRSH